MTDFVILFRNPSNSKVGFIHDGSEFESVSMFASREEAEELAREHSLLRAWPYQIVEVEA